MEKAVNDVTDANNFPVTIKKLVLEEETVLEFAIIEIFAFAGLVKSCAVQR